MSQFLKSNYQFTDLAQKLTAFLVYILRLSFSYLKFLLGTYMLPMEILEKKTHFFMMCDTMSTHDHNLTHMAMICSFDFLIFRDFSGLFLFFCFVTPLGHSLPICASNGYTGRVYSLFWTSSLINTFCHICFIMALLYYIIGFLSLCL